MEHDGQDTANSDKNPSKSYDFNISDFSFDSEIKKEIKLEPNQNESSVKVEQEEVQEVEHGIEQTAEQSLRNEENEEKKFSCHICSKKFNQFELEMHFVECLQEDSNDDNEVIRNISTTNSGNTGNGVRFIRKGAKIVGQIVETAVDSARNVFKCKTCSEEFQKSSEYIIHTRIHIGDRPHKCSHYNCPREFAYECDFKYHLKNCNFINGEKIAKNTEQDGGVTSIKINQSQIKSIKCFNCSTSFEDINSWQKHKKTCQPNAKERKYYYDHIPLQTHQKGFYCPVCGKNYKDREEMRHHLKTHPLDSLIKASRSTPEPYDHQTNPEKCRKLEQESQPSTSKQ